MLIRSIRLPWFITNHSKFSGVKSDIHVIIFSPMSGACLGPLGMPCLGVCYAVAGGHWPKLAQSGSLTSLVSGLERHKLLRCLMHLSLSPFGFSTCQFQVARLLTWQFKSTKVPVLLHARQKLNFLLWLNLSSPVVSLLLSSVSWDSHRPCCLGSRRGMYTLLLDERGTRFWKSILDKNIIEAIFGKWRFPNCLS